MAELKQRPGDQPLPIPNGEPVQAAERFSNGVRGPYSYVTTSEETH